MPKRNREQRFAVLKNIFNELGALSAQRSAPRLQIPADEARRLIEGWQAGEAPEPTAVEHEPLTHSERLASREAVRPKRFQRAAQRIQRPITGKPAEAPKRVQRPVTAKPARVVRITEVLPPEKETGTATIEGHKGVLLRAGSHVRYENGNAVGVLLGLGREVSEVKWFRTGAIQSEINKYLRKA